MGIIIISLISVALIYGLSILSYISENKILDDLITEN